MSASILYLSGDVSILPVNAGLPLDIRPLPGVDYSGLTINIGAGAQVDAIAPAIVGSANIALSADADYTYEIDEQTGSVVVKDANGDAVISLPVEDDGSGNLVTPNVQIGEDGTPSQIQVTQDSNGDPVVDGSSEPQEAAPELALTADTASVDEGGAVNFTIEAAAGEEPLAEGSEVAYTLTGVDAADIDGDLTGTAVIGADGTATVAVNLVEDGETEGEETLTMTLDGTSTSSDVTVNDTSFATTFELTAANETVQEGESLTFTVTANQAVEADTDVTFTLVPGDGSAADAGTNNTNTDDFGQGAFNPQTVTIPAGSTEVTFDVAPQADGVTELPEDFAVRAEVDGEVVGEVTATAQDAEGAAAGQTFTLTDSIDSAALNGTAGDDTYIATDETYNTGDDIDGAGGTDRLNLVVSDNANAGDTAVDAAVVDTTNIENFFVRNLDTADDAKVNASGWDGAEQIWYNRGTEGVVVSSVASLVTAGVNQGAGATSDFTIQYDPAAVSGAADVQNIVLTDADAGDVRVDDNTAAGGIETVSVQATGTNTVSTLTLGTDAETISFSGEGDLEVTNALASVTTIDGSAATGDLELTAAAAETFRTGAGDDTVTSVAATTVLETGAGDDAATLADPTAELAADFGAGDDVVDATAVTFTNTDISLDGGEGEDTIEVANTDIVNLTAAAANRAEVTGFEVLASSGLATAHDFDISDVGEGFNQLVSDASSGVAVSGFADGGTVTLTGQQTTGGSTFAVEGAGNAGRNDDTFNIVLDEDADASGQTVTVAEVENINITSSDDEAGAASNSLNLVANDALSVTITGDENLDLSTSSSFNALQTLDANELSGELTVDVSSANQGVVVTAGSDGSDITGSGNADIINGGAGADVIAAGQGDDEINLTADGEADTITFEAHGSGTSTNGEDTITGFETANDILNFYAGTAATAVDADGFTAGTAIGSNDVFFNIAGSDSNSDGTLSEAEAAASINSALTNFDSTNTDAYFLLEFGGDTLAYEFNDGAGAGTTQTADAADLTLIGTVEGTTGLEAANIA